MTGRDFAYWLQGFFELREASEQGLTPRQAHARSQSPMLTRALALLALLAGCSTPAVYGTRTGVPYRVADLRTPDGVTIDPECDELIARMRLWMPDDAADWARLCVVPEHGGIDCCLVWDRHGSPIALVMPGYPDPEACVIHESGHALGYCDRQLREAATDPTHERPAWLWEQLRYGRSSPGWPLDREPACVPPAACAQ